MDKVFTMILLTGLVTYLSRALPMILYKGKNPGKFLKSFLEYIPYAALGALLFPDILYSAGNIMVSVVGAIFAGVLILKNQNMIVTVLGTIFLVYLLNGLF